MACQDKLVELGREDLVHGPLDIWVIGRPAGWLGDDGPEPDEQDEIAQWCRGRRAFRRPGGRRIVPAQVLDAWDAPEIEPPIGQSMLGPPDRPRTRA